MVVISIISAKLAPLGHLKIKIFQNKSNEVIISVLEITNKFYSVTQLNCRCGSGSVIWDWH